MKKCDKDTFQFISLTYILNNKEIFLYLAHAERKIKNRKLKYKNMIRIGEEANTNSPLKGIVIDYDYVIFYKQLIT